MTRSAPRILLNVLIGGAVVRLLTLGGYSLWLDEGATWSWATLPTWKDTLFAEANHPPVWWLVTRAWIALFGDSEWSLRAPAALLGILVIYLAWRLGVRLLDPSQQPSRGGFPQSGDPGPGRRAALWFAGFVAASTYFIEYSQEARMYSLLVAEAVGLSLLYLRWLDKGDRASIVGYALLAALALHTQYFAIWPIAAHGAHALYLYVRTRGTPAEVRPWPMVVAMGTAGVLFLPWFWWMLHNYKSISTGEPFDPFSRLLSVIWRMGVGPGIVVVDRPRLEEGEMTVIREVWPELVVTSLLWFPALAVGTRVLWNRPGVRSFVAFGVLVPVVLILAVFPVFQLVHERYLVFLAPYVWLVATMGATLSGRLVRPVLLSSLVLLSAAGLVGWGGSELYLTPIGGGATLDGEPIPERFGADPEHPLRALDRGHPFGKEPWREAHAFVDAHAKRAAGDTPGDLVLLHPWYLHLVWDYYDRPPLEQRQLPEGLLSPDEAYAELGDEIAQHDRVFLVLAHEETDDPDAYFSVIGAAVFRAWTRDGLARVEIIPPILFDRSWGVRVAVFSRR